MTARHGKLTVYGKDKKKGEVIALTESQRFAMDYSRESLLAEAEAAYIVGDPKTDYYVIPSGKLVRGVATLKKARSAPLDRDALRKAFHELEVAAGVAPQEGRGWYGLRRIATDAAPDYSRDRRVLDKLGGWTAGSTTREDTYQNREDESLLAATAATRQAWRAGAQLAAERIPESSEALLSVLPSDLRAAVLAHFSPVSTTRVGTAVGTNNNAVGIQDSDGAVSC